jgi:DNA polymerase (family 10)
MGIESIGNLYACNENRLTLYKGFGEKDASECAGVNGNFIKVNKDIFICRSGSYISHKLTDT